MRVFGLPLNFATADINAIWQQLYNSKMVFLGDDEAEYSVAVRVYPYPNRVFSIWVFLVCVSSAG